MPGARQVWVGSVPCPPATWSARFSAWMALYSSVNGARSLSRSAGSQRGAPMRSHWPRQSGYFVSSNAKAPTQAAHAAGLDAQLVVLAVAVGVDPLPDRIAGEIRLELSREVAAVGVDAARHVVVGEDKGGVRLDQEFKREDRTRHARHAERDT